MNPLIWFKCHDLAQVLGLRSRFITKETSGLNRFITWDNSMRKSRYFTRKITITISFGSMLSAASISIRCTGTDTDTDNLHPVKCSCVQLCLHEACRHAHRLLQVASMRSPSGSSLSISANPRTVSSRDAWPLPTSDHLESAGQTVLFVCITRPLKIYTYSSRNYLFSRDRYLNIR